MYKIFIVEDDKGIADGIVTCLGNWGMEGLVVSDFMKVMEEVDEYEPHLIIMDITLPYMGGYHWCQEIRKTSSVPIIFISSATDNMNIIMAINMGADDFIAKQGRCRALSLLPLQRATVRDPVLLPSLSCLCRALSRPFLPMLRNCRKQHRDILRQCSREALRRAYKACTPSKGSNQSIDLMRSRKHGLP